MEDVTATLADGLIARHAGDLRGGRIEGRNPPIFVNGKDTIDDRVENYVLCLLLRHFACADLRQFGASPLRVFDQKRLIQNSRPKNTNSFL